MALLVFGISGPRDKILDRYMQKSGYKLRKIAFFDQPSIVKTGTFDYVFWGPHVFPRIYRIGYALIGVSAILGAKLWTWPYIVGLVFLSGGFFWSGRFYFYVLRYFAKREGYPHKLTYVPSEAAMAQLVRHMQQIRHNDTMP